MGGCRRSDFCVSRSICCCVERPEEPREEGWRPRGLGEELQRDQLSSRGVSPWCQLPQVEASLASRKTVRHLLGTSSAAPRPAQSRQTCTSPRGGFRLVPGERELGEQSPGPALHRPSRTTGVGVWPQHLPSPTLSKNSFGGRSLTFAPPAPPWNRLLALGRTVAATCAAQNGALGASAPVGGVGGGLEMSAERHLRSSPTSSRAVLRPLRHNKTPSAQLEGASSRRPLGRGWRPPSEMS